MTQSDQPALVAQMQENFDQYWADAHQFAVYEPGERGAASADHQGAFADADTIQRYLLSKSTEGSKTGVEAIRQA